MTEWLKLITKLWKVKMATTLRYDEEKDILSLDIDKTMISHSEGDDLFILDFNEEGKVVGFEILDFAKRLKVPPELLEKLKDKTKGE